MANILILENYLPLVQSLVSLFTKDNQVIVSFNLKDAKEKLSLHKFDLIIIDRGLDDGDGLEFVQYLNDQYFSIHTLILSDYNSVEDRIEGFESGADDYLSKPFSCAELKLRVNKLLATEKFIPHTIIHHGPISLNLNTRQLFFNDQEKTLCKKESSLLAYFLRRVGRIISREDLIQAIWHNDDGEGICKRTIDVNLRRLKLSLGEAGDFLESIRGCGYRLNLPG